MSLVQKSVLLKTSGRGDIQYGDGAYTIAGAGVRKAEIRSIRHVRYKANTAQVFTIGSNSYTPTASTTYIVLAGTPQRKVNGNAQTLLPFKFTTPADLTTLGNTAALQREAIHAAIVAAINANSTLLVTAASLGTGTGFTITDTGVYYGPRTEGSDNFFGASTIAVELDGNGNGWANNISTTANATAIVLTTPAVYWSGVGAYLLSDVPVVDNMFGRVISGMTAGNALFNAPPPKDASGNPAVSGQNYDLFIIDSMLRINLPTMRDDMYGYIDNQYFIFVDNGTGTSTTNLQGFLDFEKEMHKIISDVNAGPNATREFFDDIGVFSGPAGAVPAGGSGELDTIATSYGQHLMYVIGANTATAPVPGNTGYNIELDATATKGLEIDPSLFTDASREFTVGKEVFSAYGKFICTTGANAQLRVGFRKKEANQATFTSYDFYADVLIDAKTIKTEGKLHAASTQTTASTDTTTDATWFDIYMTVALDGTVLAYVNGKAYAVNSASGVPMKFAANSVVIPFIRNVNLNSSTAVPVAGQWISLNNANWIY